MAGPTYHGWTHRSKGRGGTDPIESLALWPVKVFRDDIPVATTPTFTYKVPQDLSGHSLVRVEGFVSTVGSSATTVQLVRNPTGAADDMLSTLLTIGSGDLNDDEGAVVDADFAEVTYEDHIQIQVVSAGTGAMGLGVYMYFLVGPDAVTAIRGADGVNGVDGAPGGITAWTGQWLTATAYTTNQSVSNNGSSYAAIDNHTSGATSEPGVGANWEDHWQLLAAAESGAIAESLIDAKGDLIVGTAADTADNLPVGTDGQVLVADSAEASGVKWDTPDTGDFFTTTVIKPTDENVTSSTTLQDDDDFQVSVLANTPYYFEMLLLVSSTGTADFKHAFALSTGSFTRSWRSYVGLGTTTAVIQSSQIADMTTAVVHAGAGGETIVDRVIGYFYVSANATLKLQWAQNSSDGSPGTTLSAGSSLRIRDMTTLTL